MPRESPSSSLWQRRLRSSVSVLQDMFASSGGRLRFSSGMSLLERTSSNIDPPTLDAVIAAVTSFQRSLQHGPGSTYPHQGSSHQRSICSLETINVVAAEVNRAVAAVGSCSTYTSFSTLLRSEGPFDDPMLWNEVQSNDVMENTSRQSQKPDDSVESHFFYSSPDDTPTPSMTSDDSPDSTSVPNYSFLQFSPASPEEIQIMTERHEIDERAHRWDLSTKGVQSYDTFNAVKASAYEEPSVKEISTRPGTLGGKRFPCPTGDCAKDFSTSGHARRHSRLHEESRPFSCPHKGCKATFTRRDNCMQHQKCQYGTVVKGSSNRRKIEYYNM
jgi:hypothetical protein